MRQLPASSGDAGAADPRLTAALAAGDRPAALIALARARVLVPVSSRVVARGVADATGLETDKESATELVLLTDSDGAAWLPAFSGADSFARWSRTHRPVRGSGTDVAGEALARGVAGLVLDVAGPHRLVVDGSALAAVAAGGVPGAEVDRLPLRVRPLAEDAPSVGAEAHLVEASTDGGATWSAALGVVPLPGSSVADLAAAALAAGWTGDVVPLAGALLAAARGAQRAEG